MTSSMTSSKHLPNSSFISAAEYAERRNKVLSYLKDCGKKLLIKSGREKNFSNDVHYPFRVDSDFFYLTGFNEADAVLILDPDSQNPYSLYIVNADPEKEIWEGKKCSFDDAKKIYAADKVFDVAELGEDAGEGGDWLSKRDFIHSLRTVKSAGEIETIRKACEISIQAHRVLAANLTEGIYEYELEANLHNIFRAKGANGWAYPSIVASGINSCTLHYTQNNKIIEKNDLVLVDAGCEFEYYASDITRTHATGGEYSNEQKDIYELVLKAQEAAIETIRPGGSFMETHETAAAVIGAGLAELGYIKDKHDPAQIKEYFMHSTGHSLGIDVHDPGIQKSSSKYVPGMITTVEPAIYIPEKSIGVRIEDDILVTNDGFENLTEALEK